MVTQLKNLTLSSLALAALMTVPTASALGNNCGAEKAALNDALATSVSTNLDPTASQQEKDDAAKAAAEAYSSWSNCAMQR